MIHVRVSGERPEVVHRADSRSNEHDVVWNDDDTVVWKPFSLIFEFSGQTAPGFRRVTEKLEEMYGHEVMIHAIRPYNPKSVIRV